MQNLFFVNDHDISNPTAQSVFSNIRIYEDNGSSSGAGNSVYYIQTDHLNTARAITDTTNTVVWSWLSDPFGSTAANDDPDGDGSTFTYNLRFPGQYYDQETGLHYNYFRDYDPSTGRYVQSDPIGLRGGLNTFGYVEGNPLLLVDIYGLCGECPGGNWSSYSIPAFSGFFGGGGTVAETTYTCKSTGLECMATSICFGGGPIVAAGAGGDAGSARGVEHARQFSGYSSGVYGTIGPISMTINPNGGNTGLSKSWGAGIAYITCTNIHVRCKCSECDDQYTYVE